MSELEQALRNLGVAIQADARFQAYQDAKKASDEDKVLQDQIGAFTLKKLQWQKERERVGEETEDATVKQMEQDLDTMYQEILKNEHLQAFNQTRDGYSELVQWINQMIMMFVNGSDPMTCDPTTVNCGGDCSACGGCH